MQLSAAKTQQSRTIAVNGIDLFVTERGTGPLVILCHGWPELSHSWRHQLPVLAGAGFRVAVPDMRGFGNTSAPADIGSYTILHMVGDMVALVAALGERQATIVGHDWGAVVAWHAAMLRPDIFRAVAALSVPPLARGLERPLDMLRNSGITTFYWQYFQEPGVAEREFERDVERTVRAIFYGRGLSLLLKPGGGFITDVTVPDQVPAWLTTDDVEAFVTAYRRTGYRGGLNWYRNIDRNWELSAPWQDARIMQPALFMAGARDGTIVGDIGARRLEQMDALVPNLQEKTLVEGAGHWIQQERPDEINQALLRFLERNAR